MDLCKSRTYVLIKATLHQQDFADAAAFRASASTVIRIPYIYSIRDNNDPLFIFTDLAIWSIIENGLGLSAVSLATLRPLFKKIFSKDYLTPRQYRKQKQSGYTHADNQGQFSLQSTSLHRRGSHHVRGQSNLLQERREREEDFGPLVDLEAARSNTIVELREDEEMTIPSRQKRSIANSSTITESTVSAAMSWDAGCMSPPRSPVEYGIAITRDRYSYGHDDDTFDGSSTAPLRQNTRTRRMSQLSRASTR